MKLLVLALLILYDSMLIFQLEHVKALDTMAPYAWESGDFRAMRLGRDTAERPFLDYEELAMAMLTENFDLTGKKLSGEPLFFPVRCQKEFERLSDAYSMVFADLSCFPVPESAGGDIRDVVYENGWLEERSFDGPRTHEGCDLMAGDPEAGLYPVVSMTDGVVEQAGWLKKGGWRIGIRAPAGAYLYYAHLDSYGKTLDGREWRPGDTVHAGELLGYMGDSGYGEPGTTGQFPVHLHLGIYIRTEHHDELSVNPYWILRYLEKYRTRASY